MARTHAPTYMLVTTRHLVIMAKSVVHVLNKNKAIMAKSVSNTLNKNKVRYAEASSLHRSIEG